MRQAGGNRRSCQMTIVTLVSGCGYAYPGTARATAAGREGAVVGGEHVGRGLGVVLVLGVPDPGERLLRARLGGLGQRVEHVADLVPPAPLLAGLGEHLV